MNKPAANIDAVLSGPRRRRLLPSALIVLAAAAAIAAQHKPGDPGRDLARRVLKAQETSGFQIRARVILGEEEEGARRPAILQVRMAGRREGDTEKVLYQVLYPTTLKGYAAVIEQSRAPGISGFLFEPPERIRQLDPDLLKSPFAGTGLTIEDLAENFWRWPSQRVAGQGQAGKQACTVLESRPSKDAATAYALVRSCIDPKKLTPLWVEKFDAAGNRVKRISLEIPERGNRNRDFRVSMVVEGDPSLPRTRVEILRSDRGIRVSPDEFLVQRLKSLTGR